MRYLMIMLLAVVGVAFTAQAAEYNLVPNRLSQAKAGEWVLLGNLSAPGERVKITVTDRACENGEWVVGLKREHIDEEDNVTEANDRRIKLSRYQKRIDDLDQRADRISREKMTIKDRNITVYVIEWEDVEKDREVKIWLSNDIPVGGFVRIWSSDPEFPTYEIIDFGNE